MTACRSLFLGLTLLGASACVALLMDTANGEAYDCNSVDDCERLGECVNRTCECYPGFTGPSCAQLDLVEATSKLEASWPPAGGFTKDVPRAYGWGFSVARDAKASRVFHAVANVGCYVPGGHMVSGTLLMHLTSTEGPMGPWKAAGIVAPPTTFNAHLRLSPQGEYVLFFRSDGKAPSANWTNEVCAGVSDSEWATLVEKGPYISKEKLADPVGNFVARSTDMTPGSWDVSPFVIGGQDDTCGNKSVVDHNSNPSAVILPSGTVVLAYRYTLRGGSESVNIAISENLTGPYKALFPCNYTMTCSTSYRGCTDGTWGEDPFIWQASHDGSLHMYYHCMRFGRGVPNEPALHAWSPNSKGDGRDVWHVTKSPSRHGAYSTNISLTNGSATDLYFHRRERPDVLFDQKGRPLVFYSALQETAGPENGGFGYSFSFAQRVNSRRDATQLV